MRIGFIGLGQMGSAMARRLLDAGHELIVWNRSAAAAEPLIDRGARRAGDLAETLANEVVISMLADDGALRDVWIRSGLVERTASAVHLNMTSASLGMARELGELHRKAGTVYVAAPVFGRPEIAAQGGLDIVAAGPADALSRCEPLFAALGRRWFNAGTEAHQANVVKIARNLVLATVIESLGEAFALVSACGGSAEKFLGIITSTSMNAPAYKDYGRRILQSPAGCAASCRLIDLAGGTRPAPPPEPTFPLRLGLKDVELALAAARDSGLALDNAELIGRLHRAAIDAGYGDRDWADLGNWIIEHARRRASTQ